MTGARDVRARPGNVRPLGIRRKTALVTRVQPSLDTLSLTLVSALEMFAIKAEVTDLRAKTFAFTAQKTLRCDF